MDTETDKEPPEMPTDGDRAKPTPPKAKEPQRPRDDRAEPMWYADRPDRFSDLSSWLWGRVVTQSMHFDLDEDTVADIVAEVSRARGGISKSAPEAINGTADEFAVDVRLHDEGMKRAKAREEQR